MTTETVIPNFNKEQLVAIKATSDKVLVVAGPGSGKTAVLAARVVHLMGQKVDSNKIVVITFTNAAARELQERITEMLGGPSAFMNRPIGYIGTIHGYALKLLNAHGTKIGLPERVAVIDEEHAEELLGQAAKHLHYSGTKAALAEAVKAARKHIAAGGGTPGIKPGPGLVAFEYFSRMRTDGILSFDALLGFGAHVLYKIGDELAGTQLLVDEYQDCSELLNLFCLEHPGAKYFVGDSDQAIYRFAGGDLGCMLNLAYSEPWDVYKLETNYRSTPVICEAAQRLITHNKARIPKICRAYTPNDAEAWPVLVSRFSASASEWAFILGQIKVAQNKTCAVLCRTNLIAAEAAHFLDGHGIKVRKKQRSDLPSDWSTARRLLSLLSNPECDSLAWWFLEFIKDTKYADSVKLNAAMAGKSINQYKLKMPAHLEPAQVPEIMAKTVGISPESVAMINKGIAELKPGDGLQELCIALGNATALQWEEIGEGVTVTTMHAAKGREWDWVFVAGCDDEVIPGAGGNIEEERRLLFVAITRARERVVLTTAGKRQLGSWQRAPVATKPSRFLLELGKGCE